MLLVTMIWSDTSKSNCCSVQQAAAHFLFKCVNSLWWSIWFLYWRHFYNVINCVCLMSCIQGNCYIKIIFFNLKYLFHTFTFLREDGSVMLWPDSTVFSNLVAIAEVSYLIWNYASPVKWLELYQFFLTEHTALTSNCRVSVTGP